MDKYKQCWECKKILNANVGGDPYWTAYNPPSNRKFGVAPIGVTHRTYCEQCFSFPNQPEPSKREDLPKMKWTKFEDGLPNCKYIWVTDFRKKMKMYRVSEWKMDSFNIFTPNHAWAEITSPEVPILPILRL